MEGAVPTLTNGSPVRAALTRVVSVMEPKSEAKRS